MNGKPQPSATAGTPTLQAQTLSRRHFMRLLLGGAALSVAGAGAGYAQTQQLGITRFTRPVQGLQRPLRLAFLTDLHYGTWVHAKQLERWVVAANAEQPDLIVLGGDLLDGKAPATAPQSLLSILAELKAPLGVFGVWGNHDLGFFERIGPNREQRRSQLSAQLAQRGIRMLLNEGQAIRPDLWLGGIDDFRRGYADSGAAGAGAQAGQAKLLLSHNPDAVVVLQTRWDLALCGHTHGGQVRLPLVGAVVAPSHYGTKYAMGWFEMQQVSQMYVSRGLGVSALPVRNLCMPEITLLECTPA